MQIYWTPRPPPPAGKVAGKKRRSIVHELWEAGIQAKTRPGNSKKHALKHNLTTVLAACDFGDVIHRALSLMKVAFELVCGIWCRNSPEASVSCSISFMYPYHPGQGSEAMAKNKSMKTLIDIVNSMGKARKQMRLVFAKVLHALRDFKCLDHPLKVHLVGDSSNFQQRFVFHLLPVLGAQTLSKSDSYGFVRRLSTSATTKWMLLHILTCSNHL